MESFTQTICLRVISCTHCNPTFQCIKQSLPKFGLKFYISIANNFTGDAIFTDPLLKEDISTLNSTHCTMTRDELNQPTKPIHNSKNTIKTTITNG
jgi:hypothetical protein